MAPPGQRFSGPQQQEGAAAVPQRFPQLRFSCCRKFYSSHTFGSGLKGDIFYALMELARKRRSLTGPWLKTVEKQ